MSLCLWHYYQTKHMIHFLLTASGYNIVWQQVCLAKLPQQGEAKKTSEWGLDNFVSFVFNFVLA